MLLAFSKNARKGVLLIGMGKRSMPMSFLLCMVIGMYSPEIAVLVILGTVIFISLVDIAVLFFGRGEVAQVVLSDDG